MSTSENSTYASPPFSLGNFSSLGLQMPSADEFVYSPQNHVIPAFALGCLFLLSVYYILRSVGHSLLGARLKKHMDVLPSSNTYLESQELPHDRVRDWLVNTLGGTSGLAVYNPNADIKSIGSLLSLSFTLASIMQFASLLIFSGSSGAFACQFVVSTGGIAADMARFKGLYKMSMEFGQLQVRRWEVLTFRVCIVITLLEALIFRYLTTGVLVSVDINLAPVGVDGNIYLPYALCYSPHFILPGAINVALKLILEIYALVRLYSLLVPKFLNTTHKFQALWDIRIGWALSLIALEVATAAPTIYPFGLLADFLPFAIFSIVALIIFNYRRAPIETARTATLPPLTSFHGSEVDKSSIRGSRRMSDFDFGGKGYEDYKQEWEDNSSPFETTHEQDISDEAQSGRLSGAAGDR